MLAFHYGWDINYILSLSFVQIQIMLDGLGEILDMKYNPKRAEKEDFERKKKISEIEVKNLIANIRKKEGLSDKDPVKIPLSNIIKKEK